MIKYIFVCLFFVQSVIAQEAVPSQLFDKYKNNKNESILPDFSYAGYHCGEQQIPIGQQYKVFNVIDFGAKPNDGISDRKAIQDAIAAAEKNGSGIVFFPKGRFLVNEDSTAADGITSFGSRIIFKGSGSGENGTELYMKYPLLPLDTSKMWTSPSMFSFTAKNPRQKVGKIAASAMIGAKKLQLNTTNQLKVGDWISVQLLNNAPILINEELSPNQPDPAWTYILNKGVEVILYYQVVAIDKNQVTIHAPLAYNIDASHGWVVNKFSNSEEVGVEDIAFVGNFKEKFIHHSSWKHDSGFSLFEFQNCTNSWMKNCRFTDCSVGAVVKQSANITFLNCLVNGNAGHEAITSNGSMNVLMLNLKDEASQWHSFGSSHMAMNTVIWHCTYPSTTCFEAHASQPRNTLLDNVKGGLMQNRAGGAMVNMPNHLKGLIFWNYQQTNKAAENFEFWSSKSPWWKISPPIIAGFKSGGTTFKNEQLSFIEGLGNFVTPNSLYEAQLELRLNKKQTWLNEVLNIH